MNIFYTFMGNIYEETIDLTSKKTDDDVKSALVDLNFMSIEASNPHFKPGL